MIDLNGKFAAELVDTANPDRRPLHAPIDAVNLRWTIDIDAAAIWDTKEEAETQVARFNMREANADTEEWVVIQFLNGASGIRTEEIIYSNWSEGWQKRLPVTLIRFSKGQVCIHRQTGDRYTEAIAAATQIMQERGWEPDPEEREATGSTGVYITLRRIKGGS